jgi:hypothetical protein
MILKYRNFTRDNSEGEKFSKKQFRKLKKFVTTRPGQNKYCPGFSYEAQCEITMLNEVTPGNK